MPKRITTAASVKAIKPPARGQVAHFVSCYPGLALRVSYRGTKTWLFHYRIDGRQRKLVLGYYPDMSLGDAQEAWRHARASVRTGGDPARGPAVTPPARTFETVFEEWMLRDQAKNRSADQTRGIMEREVLPKWREWSIGDIGRADCLSLVDAIVDSGRASLARRLHRHLHRLFKWSVGRGIIETNPMASLDTPGKAVKRTRVFDDTELKALWNATDALGLTAKAVIRLLVLTGQRCDEIAGLRWSYVDMERGELRLPDTEMKNAQPHVVPLSEPAIEILKETPHLGDYCFGLGGRTGWASWGLTRTALQRAMGEIPYWQFRDIRRTVRTGLSRLRIPHDVREMVIAHKKQGLDAVYDQYDFHTEKRDALEAWANHVMAVCEGGPDNVVRFAS